MLKLRLARRGAHKRPSFRIVVMPANASRDGRAIDDLGHYNAVANPSEIQVDVEKALRWVRGGAQPTERVWKLLEIADPSFKAKLREEMAKAPAELPRQAAAKPASRAPARPKAAVKAKAAAKAKATAKARPKAKAKAKAGAKPSGRKTKP